MSEIKFKTEWLDQIALLASCGDAADVRCLCSAIKTYEEDGEQPKVMTPMAQMAFTMIRADIDKKRDLHAKLSEAGLRGAKARLKGGLRVAEAKEKGEERERLPHTPTKEKEESSESITDASEDAYRNIVSAASSLSCPELVEATSEPALITLPLNDGSEWPVTTEMVTEWSSLYPAVDVMQELRNMRGWCLSKPKNRKTPRGIRAFITTWLSKEQDRGPKPTARSGTPQRRLTASEIAALPFVDPFAEIRGTQ